MKFHSVVMMVRSGMACALSFFAMAAFASAEIANGETVRVGGYAFWQFGQIVRGSNNSGVFKRQWTNSALIGLQVHASPNDRLGLVLSPEFKLNYPFPEAVNHPETVRPFGIAYINEGYGVFSLGNLEKPFMEIAAGMFTYKYNPEVRNLGEYLFRTGTYPAYILTDFDFAKARLLGLRLSTNAIKNAKADVLLISEALKYPLYDFSLIGIGSYTLLDAVTLGAGFNFARLWPVDNSKTSPKYSKLDRPASYNEYINSDGDTSYYSFKALKVMCRMTIDPKVFFGSPKIFGKEDFKLYGEIDIIGLNNDLMGKKAVDLPDSGYPALYNDITRRMPMMLGFNIPALKVLDVLAFELEYFPLMIPNDFYLVESQLSPMPNISGGNISYNPKDYQNRSVRWSLYATKMVLKGFSLTGLVAYDHLRTTYWNGSTQSSECMIDKKDWHWDLKIGFNF